MNVESIKADAIMKMHSIKLTTQKHSPEILLGLGVIGMVGATVLACQATLKAQEVVDEANVNFETIETAKKLKGGEDYTEEDYKRDRAITAGHFILGMARLYGPSVILGVISIGMLVQSRNILNSRNAAIMGAYKLLDEAYARYRERVKTEFGDEVDEYILRRKPINKEMKIVQKKGSKEIDFTETEVDEERVRDGFSPYARWFDKNSPQWRQTNELNMFFLQAQEKYVNQMLDARGHVFLNEVYDELGIPRTSQGQVTGWVKGNGDDHIDFNIFNPMNDFNADYVNGYERDRILLDFNVDGMIYDII